MQLKHASQYLHDKPERLAGLWLTPKDIGALLQINERTVVRYLEQGKLPGTKIGTKWRTARASIDALQT